MKNNNKDIKVIMMDTTLKHKLFDIIKLFINVLKYRENF